MNDQEWLDHGWRDQQDKLNYPVDKDRYAIIHRYGELWSNAQHGLTAVFDELERHYGYDAMGGGFPCFSGWYQEHYAFEDGFHKLTIDRVVNRYFLDKPWLDGKYDE